MQSLRLLLPLCAIVGLTIVCLSASAKPVSKQPTRFNDLPNLSDTLAVAKSPYEPVTLPNTLPGARNENFKTTDSPSEHESTTRSGLLEPTTNATRSHQDLEQQEKETTGGHYESTLGAAASTRSIQTEAPASETSPQAATTTTTTTTESVMTTSTDSPATEEVSSSEDDNSTSSPPGESVSSESSTTSSSDSRQPPEKFNEESTTTTTTETPAITTTTEALTTSTPTSTTTLAPETTTAGQEQLSSNKASEKEVTTTSAPQTTTTTMESAATETSPVSPSSGEDESSEKPAEVTPEASPAPTSPPSSEEEVSTETPTTTTAAPPSPKGETKSEEIAEKEQVSPTTTPEPVTTTTESTTTTTAAPVASPAPEQPSLPEAEQPSSPPPEQSGAPGTKLEPEQPNSPVSTEASTEESSSTTEAPASLPPAQTTTKAPAEEPSSVAPIEESSPPPTSTSTTTTTTTTTSSPSTTTAQEIDEAKSIGNDENKLECNHLPTYDSEEIQKVFREETTFRNGTIKGKFTYINYDQRYRLVHYTRLPYGPVKIDLVEELGRPEQQATAGGAGGLNNRSLLSPVQVGDVPNAVLQLRNILPNSLFGFPFLNPHSASNGAANKPIQSRHNPIQKEVDDSTMYFYSTDSLSTPNLLTPSVPVSVLPGQRRPSQQQSPPTIAATDTLGPSFFENLPVGAIQQYQSLSAIKPKQPIEQSQSEPMFGAPEQQHEQQEPEQHQFNTNSQSEQPRQLQQPGPIYSYLPTQAQPAQYQYSPQPIYSFGQPNYYNAVRQPLTPHHLAFSNKFKHDSPQASDKSSYLNHQSHQPHSHEHYVAPFMFAQPVGLHSDQRQDLSKLRLKVKTSKALNVESGTKSAQLRAMPQSTYSHQELQQQVPFNSPASLVHRQQQQRQRAGKQNQELEKPSINTNPIVYHILRSPVGRMYTLPQYNQAHVIAYDQDDQ